MDVLVIALYLVAAVALAYAAARVAGRRGRSPRAWAVLGILFPFAAVILVAILPPPQRDED